MAFHETSAKDNLAVDAAFLDLARNVKSRLSGESDAFANNDPGIQASPCSGGGRFNRQRLQSFSGTTVHNCTLPKIVRASHLAAASHPLLCCEPFRR
jgi:hypothetical protein